MLFVERPVWCGLHEVLERCCCITEFGKFESCLIFIGSFGSQGGIHLFSPGVSFSC